MKQILITGGTGFIGSALVKKLLTSNFSLTILSRQKNPDIAHSGEIKIIHDLNQIADNSEFEAIINLAGEGIADKRWSKKRKKILEDSRIALTYSLINLCKRLQKKPNVFISGSAVGYYGNGQDKALKEDSNAHNDYAHRLCQSWESAALQAEELSIRTCIVRTGLVIGKNGGFLKKMLPVFQRGLGGQLADGKQWMSWIHLRDMVHIIEFLLVNEACRGVYNATSPEPVRNADFTHALNNVLHKSGFVATPAWLLKILFGEMSDLLIYGQRVLPAHLQKDGFTFRYPNLNEALADAVSRDA